MYDWSSITVDKAFVFILSWVLAQGRMTGFFAFIPLFHQQVLPGILRSVVSSIFSLIMVPVLMVEVGATHLNGFMILGLFMKEVFVGAGIGFFCAVPFWSFEAAGFLIDNQRGASVASIINPLSDSDSSPTGIFFSQTFIALFVSLGGINLLLTTLYHSFSLWGIISWVPHLDNGSIPLLLSLIDRLVGIGVLLASPALIAMFLVELGLGLISRFAPQLQVFFIAMPVKSALALFVLVIYASSLFQYATQEVFSLQKVIPYLREYWDPSGKEITSEGY